MGLAGRGRGGRSGGRRGAGFQGGQGVALGHATILARAGYGAAIKLVLRHDPLGGRRKRG
jgi:hypothetical protein